MNKQRNVWLGLPQSRCERYFGFTLEDAQAMPLEPTLGLCEPTCGSLQQGASGCPAVCAASPVTLLAPGGHHDVA